MHMAIDHNSKKNDMRQVNKKFQKFERQYRDCIKRNRDKIWTETMCYVMPACHAGILNVKGWCHKSWSNPYIVV